MMQVLHDAGIFIYPLGLCSFLAVFIIAERCRALCLERVLPRELEHAVRSARSLPANPAWKESTAGIILRHFEQCDPEPEVLRAFARWQVSRLERGLFILETIIGVAPLLGLLGTITGLVRVFSGVASGGGIMPESSAFVGGIALALTTTMLGLAIAIPTLVAHAWLNRRVDLLAARMEPFVEQLLMIRENQQPPVIPEGNLPA